MPMDRFIEEIIVVEVLWRRWRSFRGIVVVVDAVDDDVYEKRENEGRYDQSFSHEWHDVFMSK